MTMTTRQLGSVLVRFLLVLSFLFGAVPLGEAQQRPTTEKSAKAEEGPKEGIKVHGHWMIVVRNSDGSVTSHTEFENALQFAGKNLLASFLKQQSKPGRWTVVLDNLSGSKACEGGTFGGTFPGLCYVTEPDSSPTAFAGTNVSRNLSATLVADANNVNSIVLSGSIKSLQQGGIDRVYTTLGACDILAQGFCLIAETSSSSSSGFSFAFTPTTISVQAGQTIDVTVKFTLS